MWPVRTKMPSHRIPPEGCLPCPRAVFWFSCICGSDFVQIPLFAWESFLGTTPIITDLALFCVIDVS